MQWSLLAACLVALSSLAVRAEGEETLAKYVKDAGPLQLGYVMDLCGCCSRIYRFSGQSNRVVWLFDQNRKLFYDEDALHWHFYVHTSKVVLMDGKGYEVKGKSELGAMLRTNLSLGLTQDVHAEDRTFAGDSGGQLVRSLLQRMEHPQRSPLRLAVEAVVDVINNYPFEAQLGGCILVMLGAGVLQMRYLAKFRRRHMNGEI